jgi:hypothetical protein
MKQRKLMSFFLCAAMLAVMLSGLSFGGHSASASSPYEVPVSLPACDSSNSKVQFISSVADWNTINDPLKTIFCVQPGDYLSKGNINLTTSGTSTEKRYIRYFNPSNPSDNTHPVNMSSSDRATVLRLTFQGADFVVVDRLHVKQPIEEANSTSRNALVRFHGSYESTDNVLNRLLAEGGGDGGGQINFNGAAGSDRNTLQLSVVRKTIIDPGNDIHCVLITGDAEDTRVISNELYNCAGDVLQLHPGVYDGTIIANNDMYNDPDFVQYTENGIDIKGGGSSGSGNQVIIEGNRFFSLGGEGGTGGSIGAIDFSNDTGEKAYILFKNNIFFDNPLPWTTNTGGGTGSSHHLSFVGNLIYNTGAAAIEPIKNTNSIEIYYNTVISVASGGKWLHGTTISPASQDVMCNVVIDGGGYTIPASGTTSDYNAYYNTSGQLPGTNNVSGSTASASNNTSYTFQYKLLTGAQNYTIPNAVTSLSSPHKNMCSGASVGSRTGMGVDDASYSQADAGAALTSGGGSGDTTAPTVSVTAPTAGSTVSGTSVAVSANASDNVGVVGVQFKVDGVNLGAEDTVSPYTVNWNTTTATNGSHSITAVARDAAGNTTTSSAVNVTVSNSGGDTTAPTVSVTAPTAGSTVSGTSVAVSANASDNVGVVGVQFKVDGVNLGAEDTVSPYTVNWNTTTAANGSHSITAVARDAAGNTTTSSAVSTTVSNGSGGTTLISLAFVSGDDSNFTEVSGDWNIENARYQLKTAVSGSAPNNNISVHNTTISGDYTMEVVGRVKGTSGVDQFGILFNYQDTNNYYYVNFSESNTTTTHGLFKVSGGTQTQLADFSTVIADDTNYSIKIERIGSTINVYRDSTLLVTVTDSSFTGGKIGFGGNQTLMAYDNLTVTN